MVEWNKEGWKKNEAYYCYISLPDKALGANGKRFLIVIDRFKNGRFKISIYYNGEPLFKSTYERYRFSNLTEARVFALETLKEILQEVSMSCIDAINTTYKDDIE